MIRDEARPTLEDVAAHAGVSRSTASRALNEESYVSARSREKVLNSARELGYSPNQAARSLVTRRTNAVALVLSEPETKVLEDPYFAEIVRGAFRELSALGSQMLMMLVDSKEDIPGTVRFLDGGHVDGALIFASHQADQLPAALRSLRLPMVFGGGRPGGTIRGLHLVDFDNTGGAKLAVEHLQSLGRKRIGTVSGPLDQRSAVDRRIGWQQTLGLSERTAARLSEEGDFTPEGGEQAMRRLLTRVPNLDAVFVANDPMAAGALRALQNAGRRVPEDVALVGFDDHPGLAEATNPPLTTVHQDPREQIRQMMATLHQLIDGDAPAPRRRVLPVRLVRRASA
ncbi:LacI family DNA-binding transcriptional regulator [Crossiella cryophila]|uniref:DNA-binding LacI/PurR family transcriptional regulator n=1 Tax=Crossiella cryophila TaxID=43355 RepID=A0A7W7CFZ7_9PSEU|nr:LacI family DNA-binding transcriptional regulator [Crossiella cryophila]MBB4680474.1 DNA-binding LacI/PurR family transcriptional regulator [Crossiella cryophila]